MAVTIVLTAAMIRAGAEWLKAMDARDDVDPGYEAIAEGMFRQMLQASVAGQERWDDAVARELMSQHPKDRAREERLAKGRAKVRT